MKEFKQLFNATFKKVALLHRPVLHAPIENFGYFDTFSGTSIEELNPVGLMIQITFAVFKIVAFTNINLDNKNQFMLSYE